MKTLTLRVDDQTYQTIKTAAQGQKRNLSNFIEYATMQYLTSSQYIHDSEMEEILENKPLMEALRRGKLEAENGDYDIVRV